MSDNSAIEWTDATWNPVIGCSKVSPGCDHCYAIRTAHRMQAHPNPKVSKPYAGTESGGEWTGRVNMVAERLELPLRWRRPRLIFVNSHSDLFHDSVPEIFIAQVWAVMALAPQHTFQVLTKRHGRMRSLLTARDLTGAGHSFEALVRNAAHNMRNKAGRVDWPRADDLTWPLPNVWLGVSTETQKWADIRIPTLLDIPAAVRWISAEPLLGPIDVNRYRSRWSDCPTCDGAGSVAVPGGGSACPDCAYEDKNCRENGVDWVVAGGESGHGARPMHPDWARSLRDQCQAADVPFLFKQWGEYIEATEPVPSDRWLTGEGITHDEPWCPDQVGSPEGKWSPYPDVVMRRVGKKAAGRELDGRIWDQYPEAVSVR